MNPPAIAATWLIPSANPRRSAGNASVRIAVEFANSIAAPTPCTSRHHALAPLDRRGANAPVAGAADPAAAAESEITIKRGQTAFNEGNYAEAVRKAREAVTGGQAVAGHLLLGDSYYHLQRYADAVREYQSVLALEPANALARRGRELAERAAAAE